MNLPTKDVNKSPTVKVDSHLTHREVAALRSHTEAFRRGTEQPLHPTLQAELFELFLSGMSCEEIQRTNKALRLGQIVRAHEESDWHNRRLEYTKGLLDNIREIVQQVQAESVRHVALALTAMHKLHGEKFTTFIRTGNADDLGEFKNWGLSQYKTLAELLLKLTGQDGQKRTSLTVQGQVEHGGTVGHRVEGSPSNLPPATPLMAGPPSSDDATRLLEALYNIPAAVKS